MYAFASVYHPPHHIVRPNPLNLKLGSYGLEAEVLVEVERDNAGVAPEEICAGAADVVEARL